MNYIGIIACLVSSLIVCSQDVIEFKDHSNLENSDSTEYKERNFLNDKSDSELQKNLEMDSKSFEVQDKKLGDEKSSENNEELELIDKIIAVVYAKDAVEIVTQSDVDRPGLAGNIRTLEDILFDIQVYLDAQKFNMLPDDQALDAFIASIQKDNNLTLEQVEQLFTQAGYSVEEGREQLKRMQTISSFLDFKINSNLVVPRKDIVTYFENNPETTEASYLLERAFIPFSRTKSKDQQRDMINEFMRTGKRGSSIEWSEPFWVDHLQIAEDKQFIYTLGIGQIMFVEDAEGFVLFRLKDKKESRLLSLEERYNEIAHALRRPRYLQMVQEYKKELFDNATIVYF